MHMMTRQDATGKRMTWQRQRITGRHLAHRPRGVTYIAASEAANEGVWMKEFISDLGVIPSASGPMKIFCDNTGAIALAKESRFHKRTKHIKRRFNSIRHQVSEGDIEICKIHTDLNVADQLTKPLSRAKHDQHQDSMGVRIITI